MSVTLKSEGSAVAQAAEVSARHKYGPHTHTHTHTRTHAHTYNAQFFLHRRHRYGLLQNLQLHPCKVAIPAASVLTIAPSHRGRMSGIELLPGKNFEQFSLRWRMLGKAPFLCLTPLSPSSPSHPPRYAHRGHPCSWNGGCGQQIPQAGCAREVSPAFAETRSRCGADSGTDQSKGV